MKIDDDDYISISKTYGLSTLKTNQTFITAFASMLLYYRSIEIYFFFFF